MSTFAGVRGSKRALSAASFASACAWRSSSFVSCHTGSALPCRRYLACDLRQPLTGRLLTEGNDQKLGLEAPLRSQLVADQPVAMST